MWLGHLLSIVISIGHIRLADCATTSATNRVIRNLDAAGYRRGRGIDLVCVSKR